MLECQVGIQSDTLARKAQNLLRRYGYPSKLQRQMRTAPDGCSYLLTVRGASREVARLLTENDIPYLSLHTVRDTG
jgi:hypothetical protein